ncbi:polysaccharide pyruvyl transferase family protein [Shewanella sp. JM162201]|uniref:Polysaccharide pyruvyl transferase family protein n=1 Tax=Shewanella jiangmenensis TaxID=2837387 RepID=A0ABS5UYU8_9GAMM|nr:polysaccharide pyruvyl transferase family protein [Shewanella jiangmenensis]MBT1443317.1 polysaccharide pyruvyl transferase family protein [Shewanella jiangmenensis]
MQSIAEYFTRNNISDFIFVPNPGNAGDALINAASFQVFEQAGLNYQLMSPRALRKAILGGKTPQDLGLADKVVVLGGGGAFTANYSHSATLIRALHGAVRRLILLPCTVEGHESLLSQLGCNVSIFCRERVSFEHVQQHCHGPEVALHPDMAFSLQLPWLLGQPIGAVGLKKRLRLYFGKRAMTMLIQRRGTASLNAFRLDVESCARAIPPDNRDLSQLFSLGCQTRAQNLASAWSLLEQVARFEHINTNRLHVAVAAFLLGKRLDFYANSYFKNRAVYEYSMAGRAEQVNFIGPALTTLANIA